jgi:hypothetical protein
MAAGRLLCCSRFELLSLFREAFLKGLDVFETTPSDDHGALLSIKRKAGAQLAFSSQIKATNRAVILL